MPTVNDIMLDVQNAIDTTGTMYAEWATEALAKGGIAALQAECDHVRSLPRPSHLRLFVYETVLVMARDAERTAAPVTPSPVTPSEN
jgi:hypothetical protein